MGLHYQFPMIDTLGDVLPHIDDRFRVVEKEGLTFINYLTPCPDTFPPVAGTDALRAAVRRECRGITFDSGTGEIVSRPFHKFFNAGERPDMAIEMIDVSRPHHVLEKLDGSMIRPLPTPHGVRWGTKMGLTDVALLAETWASDKKNYLRLAVEMSENGYTPLFEWCSRSSRIILDYPKDRLVLLAVRNTRTGNYATRDSVLAIGLQYGVEVVAEDPIRSIAALPEYVADRRLEDQGEGVVITFHDGHRCKVKTDWYVRVHRAKEVLASERRLVALWLEDELDDLMPTLPNDDQDRIDVYILRLMREIDGCAGALNGVYQGVREIFYTKKDFALSPLYAALPSPIRALVFALWNGKMADARVAVLQVIENSLGSTAKWEQTKMALGLDTGWNATEEEELLAA